MASSSSQSEMLFVGQQCSDEHCYLVDFLPFKCQHCSKMYCGDHFKPADHNCEKYDASKFDRVAPSCPICNLPVAMPPGQDPNIKMTDHIERECGKRKEEVSKVPRCANGKCHKVLYAPIKCDTCHQQFCAEHRFPTTHKCVTQTTSSATAFPRQDTSGQAKSGAKFKQAVGIGSAKTNAGMAAVKRAMASSTSTSTSTTGTKLPARVSSQAQSSTPTTKSTAPSSHTNPFSKSDRRARAEYSSRLKGLRERAKRGLLTENEQVLLAEEEDKLALRGKKGKNNDCVII